VHVLLPELDREARAPLAAQIAGFYVRAIDEGRMRVGDRLPPIRTIASACDVTRATVQDAYKQLADQGLVEGAVGRGTTVLPQKHAAGAGPVASARTLSPYAEAALRRSQDMVGAPPLPPGTPLVANFAELAPDAERFPVDAWRGAMDAVLQQRGAELLGYGYAHNGLPELRAMLAERSREIDPTLTGDDVLVTAGAQQALDLVLRTFCAGGDTVVVAAPCYHQMHGLLRAHGLNVVPVPFTAQGLDLAQLERALVRRQARLVYLTPTFHNPTGRTLDLAQRRALLEIVGRTGTPIVEDEYQTSLRTRGEPLPTLRSLDPRGLTVTVSTVSKDLFPGLRIGWIAGSQDLLRPMAAVKRFMDLETSPLLQAALVEFVRNGHFDRYLTALRGELRLRHAALQDACRAQLPAGCSVTDPDGGFVAWLELPEPGHGERLADLAADRGVRVVPGRLFDLHGLPSRGVRLSLTRADRQQIHNGVAVLAAQCRALLAAPVPGRAFV